MSIIWPELKFPPINLWNIWPSKEINNMNTNEFIKELQSKKHKLEVELEDINDAIKAIQKLCNHNWKYKGHGHTSDYYVCTICGTNKED